MSTTTRLGYGKALDLVLGCNLPCFEDGWMFKFMEHLRTCKFKKSRLSNELADTSTPLMKYLFVQWIPSLKIGSPHQVGYLAVNDDHEMFQLQLEIKHVQHEKRRYVDVIVVKSYC